MRRKITKIVAYFRLSKPKKGKDKQRTMDEAYGIAAQQQAVEELAERHGAKIIAIYKEIETGTSKKKRPKLALAISHARLHKATLVIAKLDRLARNVAFTSALMESKTDFVACDNPEATPLTIHMLAAVAEHEAKAISQRTRDGLEMAKKKGVLLGSSRPGHWEGREGKRGWKKANKVSAEVRRERARDAYRFLIPKVRQLREGGFGLKQIADWLNHHEHVTTRNMPFRIEAVRRMLALFEGEEVAA